MSNWIKPEKCARPIINLDYVKSIGFGLEEFEDHQDSDDQPKPYIIFQFQDSPESVGLWYYNSKEDRDHDYQRILKKLGLE